MVNQFMVGNDGFSGQARNVQRSNDLTWYCSEL